MPDLLDIFREKPKPSKEADVTARIKHSKHGRVFNARSGYAVDVSALVPKRVWNRATLAINDSTPAAPSHIHSYRTRQYGDLLRLWVRETSKITHTADEVDSNERAAHASIKSVLTFCNVSMTPRGVNNATTEQRRQQLNLDDTVLDDSGFVEASDAFDSYYFREYVKTGIPVHDGPRSGFPFNLKRQQEKKDWLLPALDNLKALTALLRANKFDEAYRKFKFLPLILSTLRLQQEDPSKVRYYVPQEGGYGGAYSREDFKSNKRQVNLPGYEDFASARARLAQAVPSIANLMMLQYLKPYDKAFKAKAAPMVYFKDAEFFQSQLNYIERTSTNGGVWRAYDVTTFDQSHSFASFARFAASAGRAVHEDLEFWMMFVTRMPIVTPLTASESLDDTFHINGDPSDGLEWDWRFAFTSGAAFTSMSSFREMTINQMLIHKWLCTKHNVDVSYEDILLMLVEHKHLFDDAFAKRIPRIAWCECKMLGDDHHVRRSSVFDVQVDEAIKAVSRYALDALEGAKKIGAYCYDVVDGNATVTYNAMSYFSKVFAPERGITNPTRVNDALGQYQRLILYKQHAQPWFHEALEIMDDLHKHSYGYSWTSYVMSREFSYLGDFESYVAAKPHEASYAAELFGEEFGDVTDLVGGFPLEYLTYDYDMNGIEWPVERQAEIRNHLKDLLNVTTSNH